jgi:hypothetical protein
MRVSTLGRQHTNRRISTNAKFPAPCLPVTWEESLQAVAGKTLKNYKDDEEARHISDARAATIG